MRKTTNYGLTLYDKTDKMIITAEENSLNNNMELIDEALKNKTTIEDMTNYIEEHKDELKGADGINGADGIDGEDGYSPTATVTQTETGSTITITDKNGTTISTITNGKNGEKGQDGYTPIKGVDYFDGKDGVDGKDYVLTETDKEDISKLVEVNIPTKVSELENDSNYLSSVPLEYVTETELSGKEFATESFVMNKIAEAELSGGEVDLSGLATKDELNAKVDKVKGKSLIDDTEIERLSNVRNYDDTEIRGELNSKANTNDVPTKTSELTNDSGFISSYTESDPTVPTHVKNITSNDISNWNGKSNFSGSYNDLTNTPKIPTSVSELSNDKGYLTSVPSDYKTKTENDALYQPKGNYLTSFTEIDPTVPSHVKNITSTDISNWNNKSTFSGNYNDLSNKPTIPTVPTNVSAFTNDKGYLTSYTETDPTVPSHVKSITTANITSWNNKSNFSGSYNDLTNKPTIPTVPTNVSAFNNDSGYLTEEDVKEILEAENSKGEIRYITPSFTGGYYLGSNGQQVANVATMAYTEKIAVEDGDKVKIIVASTSNNGRDIELNYTTVVAYNENGEVISSLYSNGVGNSLYEYEVKSPATHIVVSAHFLRDAYSNQRIQITPANYGEEEEGSAASLSLLRNDYTFSLPSTFYMRSGGTARIYFRNLTTPNYLVKISNSTNATILYNYTDYAEIISEGADTKPFQVVVYDNHYNEVETGSLSLKMLETPPVSQKMLIIGDSFISMNVIVPRLRELFAADGNTLTLIGTKGSGSNLHEGIGGKKYTDYANGFSGSVFGTSGFDFSSYMSNQGYSGLNSVYIQLGTNDASASNPNQDVSGVITAMNTMINSIHAYDSSIKIYIGLTVMPNANSEKFTKKIENGVEKPIYDGIGWNWIMKFNMQKLNERILDECANKTNVKVVAMNCVLDTTEDIRDNVHPTDEGFRKMAEQLYYTMMS